MEKKWDIIDIIMLCLTFYEPPAFQHELFLVYKYIIISILLIKYYKEIRNSWSVILPVIMYGLVTLISSIMNAMALNTIVASFMYGIQIVTIFFASHRAIRRYGVYVYVNWLSHVFGCLAVLSDLLMLFVKYDFSNPSEKYLIGNKFVIAYVHCFWTALTFYKYKMLQLSLLKNGKINCKKLSYACGCIVVAFLSLFMCIRVTTSTGMISVAVLIILMIVPAKIQRILSSGCALIATAGGMNALIFGTAQLMTNFHVQNFIQNVLGKTSTFNGRVQIWTIIFSFIRKKAWLGYGYYNGIIEKYLGYGNPQNGILKILLDTGIIGLLCYAALIFVALRPINSRNFKINFPILAFLYAMIVASMVEINLTHMIVFLSLAIIAYGCEGKEMNS